MRALVSLVALAACSHSSSPGPTTPAAQSFAEGVQALCDLPDHVPDNGERYDKRLAAVARWADEHITNPDARQVGNVQSLAANKDALAAAVKKAGIAQCKLLDNGMELQSFADAVKTMCNAPTTGTQEYLSSHLLNAELVQLFASLGDVNPAERAEHLRDAVTRAGLTSCPLVDRMSQAAPGTMPELADRGLAPYDGGAATLVLGKDGIVVDGKAIVAIKNGAIDADELEGGAAGSLIKPLKTDLQALADEVATKGHKDPDTGVITLTAEPLLNIVGDPATPYELLIRVLYTAKMAGFHHFAIAVHAGSATKAIPVVLPAPAPPGAPSGGLKMIVTILKDKLSVWSISGQAGTLQKPLLEVAPDHTADIQSALAKVATEHHVRDAERQIIVLPGGDIPLQKLAEVMAAVRADASGKPLFPDILLSRGFE